MQAAFVSHSELFNFTVRSGVRAQSRVIRLGLSQLRLALCFPAWGWFQLGSERAIFHCIQGFTALLLCAYDKLQAFFGI